MNHLRCTDRNIRMEGKVGDIAHIQDVQRRYLIIGIRPKDHEVIVMQFDPKGPVPPRPIHVVSALPGWSVAWHADEVIG